MIKAGCPVDVVASNGATVLHTAAQVSNTEVISVVLSTGCDINATDNDGVTPLHVAAGNGNTETALELLRHGANKAVVAGLRGTPLHRAAGQGHVSTVKAMIKAGCPVDVVSSNGTTVLHYAAQVSNAKVISVVLSARCDINATDNDGVTPLHVAASNGKTETALELLRHGANKAVVAGLWGTPLHQAVGCGNVSTVKAMIKAGCPVDVVASNGATVLHTAAQVSNAEVISVVLSTGCDINATDNDGVTPLHVAAGNGNTETALELLRHGANKAVVAGLVGTPLHHAVLRGHVSTVKAMIKAGCPVDVVASNGATVLHTAAQVSNTEVISVVLSARCDINATDNDGVTPLHVAASNGNTETALELLRHGANKAVVAGLRGTPLHRAAGQGHVSTVKAMIKAGCPVDVVSSNGTTVLHYAAKGGNAELIKELLTCTECEINATYKYGITPLHLAAVRGKSEALQELIRWEMAQKGGVKSIHADVHVWTPLHCAVMSRNKECVRILLEHGADPMKAKPYIGSSYHYAAIAAPAVVEEFDNFVVEEDDIFPCMQFLSDPLLSRYVPKVCFRRSFLEKDTFGMSQLEYHVVWFQIPDEAVLLLHELSLVSRHNLLLLAAIHGLCTLIHILTHGSAIHSSFAAYTVTYLVNFNYVNFEKVPQYHELVPPDATLNLLHVALLSLKGRTSGEVAIGHIKGDHSSFLKLLVTSDSFRHTLHEYLPDGLTPLDLAEKLGLGEAVSIISSAGGRHGIYAMISEEVRLQHGPTMLLVHQELMKLASSGALGQQALQTVLSQLPGRATVEQGTATDESYICQEKLLDQKPKLNILSNYVVGNFNVVRWRLLGTSLEVPQEVLSHISSTHSSCEDKYLEVLIYWLSHNKAANWRTLLDVLGHFETKNTLDKLLQEVLATQDSQVSRTVEVQLYIK